MSLRYRTGNQPDRLGGEFRQPTNRGHHRMLGDPLGRHFVGATTVLEFYPPECCSDARTDVLKMSDEI